jgi:hypothetical protein
MSTVVPSCIAKLGRAEKHLVELEEAIDIYGGSTPDTRPYSVGKRVEGKKKPEVYRLHFTRSPTNTDIPLIAADVIYNLRSSLEHLLASMAPAKDRDSLMFPIFWRGVWEPFVEGENKQRRKDRERWAAIDRALPSSAVAHLKRLQPPDDGGQEVHALRLLNQLSNTDRHTKLPVTLGGLTNFMTKLHMKDGSDKLGIGAAHPGRVMEDKTEIKGAPKGAVNVEIVGTPLVSIRIRKEKIDGRMPWISTEIPDALRGMHSLIGEQVIPPLLEYIRD